MMAEMLAIPGALGAFALVLLVFGFLPGMVLSWVVRMIPDQDRRLELQAEVYEVPRWERPFWVAQQFEVAVRIGLFPEVAWWWGRHVWHRCRLECGLESHRKWPDTFDIPDDDDKAELRAGDWVKLEWSVKRFPGERMWVRVTHRDADRLTGTLNNWPIYAHLNPGEVINFHIDDIIDCTFAEEATEDDPPLAA